MSVKIHTRKLDEPHVVIAESEWRSLIEVARHISPVDVEEALPNADGGWRIDNRIVHQRLSIIQSPLSNDIGDHPLRE